MALLLQTDYMRGIAPSTAQGSAVVLVLALTSPGDCTKRRRRVQIEQHWLNILLKQIIKFKTKTRNIQILNPTFSLTLSADTDLLDALLLGTFITA